MAVPTTTVPTTAATIMPGSVPDVLVVLGPSVNGDQ